MGEYNDVSLWSIVPNPNVAETIEYTFVPATPVNVVPLVPYLAEQDLEQILAANRPSTSFPVDLMRSRSDTPNPFHQGMREVGHPGPMLFQSDVREQTEETWTWQNDQVLYPIHVGQIETSNPPPVPTCSNPAARRCNIIRKCGRCGRCTVATSDCTLPLRHCPRVPTAKRANEEFGDENEAPASKHARPAIDEE